MTSIINNENENIVFVQNEANKENCHNNMDEFINNQINIAKNHSKSKQIQVNQINKGLNVLDPNNNCIKKPNSFIQNKPETKNENLNFVYCPFMELSSNYFFPQNGNYNSNNNLNAVNPNANENEEKIECSNNSDDIEIVSSTKGNEENENMLIFSSPNFCLEEDESISEHKNFEENIKKIHDSLIKLDININKLAKKRESDNMSTIFCFCNGHNKRNTFFNCKYVMIFVIS